MTDQVVTNQVQDQKPNDKELNFRALEAKLHQERLARLEAEKKAEESLRIVQESKNNRNFNQEEEDSDDEPYIDKKKLNKTLAKFGEQTKQQTQSEIQKAVQTALQEERKQNWLKNNSDFYDVLQHAEKFAQYDPELAETILTMPDNFERQKLVYKNIKALGLHQEKQKQTTIQDKIDANRKTPYYQPSGVASSPYSQVGDFSQAGQEQAYKKMQELKSKLRI